MRTSIPLVLSSALSPQEQAAGIVKTSGKFTIQLGNPIETPGQWQVCLYSASFPAPVAPQEDNSIFITLDFCARSSVNNNSIPLLFKTERAVMLPQWTPTYPPGPPTPPSPGKMISFTTKSAVEPWVDIDQSVNVIDSLTCRIFPSSGDAVPDYTPFEQYSTIFCFLRRVA